MGPPRKGFLRLLLYGENARYFEAEVMPKIRHNKPGLVSMVNCGNNMLGSQFFITLGEDLVSLDGEHCVFGEISEGIEIIHKLNEAICDNQHRPYKDIRITHTVVLEDPFEDPSGLVVPDMSPEATKERLANGRIGADEEIDETAGLTMAEVEELRQEREAKARATILEIVGDLPDADVAPPENVLFVCKLNPVTTDEDLEIIFNRFGKVKSCEIIRDKTTGDSLQYAFVEFEDQKSCEEAYFKMDNVLIDDRRIHVDFSQSTAKERKIRWKGKGKGVEHLDQEDNNKDNKASIQRVRDKSRSWSNSRRDKSYEDRNFRREKGREKEDERQSKGEKEEARQRRRRRRDRSRSEESEDRGRVKDSEDRQRRRHRRERSRSPYRKRDSQYKRSYHLEEDEKYDAKRRETKSFRKKEEDTEAVSSIKSSRKVDDKDESSKKVEYRKSNDTKKETDKKDSNGKTDNTVSGFGKSIEKPEDLQVLDTKSVNKDKEKLDLKQSRVANICKIDSSSDPYNDSRESFEKKEDGNFSLQVAKEKISLGSSLLSIDNKIKSDHSGKKDEIESDNSDSCSVAQKDIYKTDEKNKEKYKVKTSKTKKHNVSDSKKRKKRHYSSSSESSSESTESSESSSSTDSSDYRPSKKKKLIIAKRYYRGGKLVKEVKKKKTNSRNLRFRKYIK